MVALDLDINGLKVTMVCSVALYLKFFVTTMIQGGKRFAAGSRPPEDTQLSLSKKFKAKQTYGMEKHDNSKHAEADIRWQRIVMNDLENILIGLLIAWGSLFCPFSTLVHMVGTVTFTISRILHTYAYAHAMQPGRAIFWALSHLSIMILGVNGVLGVLSM